MSDKIIAAIIGFSGTVFGALIIILGKDITSRFRTPKLYKNLLGMWNCDWFVDEDNDSEILYVSDVVEILKINNEEFTANGYNQNGNYRLKGYISKIGNLSMTYQSLEEKRSLTGTVFLEMEPLGNKMTGRWYGYTKEKILKGGRVLWSQQ